MTDVLDLVIRDGTVVTTDVGTMSMSSKTIGGRLIFTSSGIIAISAVIAMSTVLLVFQLGQPRIWMAMSRDGLLPPIFSRIHKRFQTPWFSTIVTGLLVAVPSLFMNLTEVTDLSSIGTLFAFVLVSGGVLLLDRPDSRRKYVPYVNSQYLVPVALILITILAHVFNGEGVVAFFSMSGDLPSKVPLFIWMIFAALMAFWCFRHKLTLIPVLGVLTCSYLMTELGVTNWIRFALWLIAGLVVYFLYGYKHSKLGQPART